MDASPRRTIGPREQLERATAETLTTLDFGPPATEMEATERAHNYQRIIAVLAPYGDETLQRLIATASTSIGDLNYLLVGDLCDLLVGTTPDEEYLNDWMTAEPFAFAEGFESDPIVKGLQHYKTLTPYHGGHYPARRAEQVLAITRVTAHFADTGNGIDYDENTHDFNMEYIEDEKLREILTTHENPGVVADLIIQRNITSAEQLPELLDTMSATPNALTGGVI